MNRIPALTLSAGLPLLSGADGLKSGNGVPFARNGSSIRALAKVSRITPRGPLLRFPTKIGLGVGVVIAARADAAPLQYLTGAGDKATPVVALTWGVIAVSLVVTMLDRGTFARGDLASAGPDHEDRRKIGCRARQRRAFLVVGWNKRFSPGAARHGGLDHGGAGADRSTALPAPSKHRDHGTAMVVAGALSFTGTRLCHRQ